MSVACKAKLFPGTSEWRTCLLAYTLLSNISEPGVLFLSFVETLLREATCSLALPKLTRKYIPQYGARLVLSCCAPGRKSSLLAEVGPSSLKPCCTYTTLTFGLCYRMNIDSRGSVHSAFKFFQTNHSYICSVWH